MISAEELVPEQLIEEVAYKNGYYPPTLRQWFGCRCSTSHKTTAAWIKCRLNFYHDNGENKSKPTFDTSRCDGKQPWLVLMKTYSGDYYTSYNGRSINRGYFTYKVLSFDSHRDALNEYHRLNVGKCMNHFEAPNNCHFGPCQFVEPYIVQVSSFR